MEVNNFREEVSNWPEFSVAVYLLKMSLRQPLRIVPVVGIWPRKQRNYAAVAVDFFSSNYRPPLSCFFLTHFKNIAPSTTPNLIIDQVDFKKDIWLVLRCE